MLHVATDVPNLTPLRRLTVARYLGPVGGPGRTGKLARVESDTGEQFVVRLPRTEPPGALDTGPTVDCLASLFMRAAGLPVPERVLLDVPPGCFADAFRRADDAKLRRAWDCAGTLTSGGAYCSGATECTAADVAQLSPATLARALWMETWLLAQDRHPEQAIGAAGMLWFVDFEHTALLNHSQLRNGREVGQLAIVPKAEWWVPDHVPVGCMREADAGLAARFTPDVIDAVLALVPDVVLAERVHPRREVPPFEGAEARARIRRALTIRLVPPRPWAAWLIRHQQLALEAAA